MNLLINGNFEHIKNNIFRRYSHCLCDRGFKIASPDFSYSKRILTGFPVVKSYLIKSKTKYNFNKRLGKNNFQFFY